MQSILKQFPIVQCTVAKNATAACGAFLTARHAKWLVVADTNTAQFAAALPGERFIFDVPPEPLLATAQRLAAGLAGYDAALAVGSGTISDLVKYAAFLAKKPYVMLATAPSMNGYFSITASLKGADGHKVSHQAQLPVALFADVETLAQAPMRLIQSGLGDAICRSTAQADWLLSHLLIDSVYDPEPFQWMKPYELAAFAKPGAVEPLMQWLLIGGLGMTHCGGSYPASQGEHMLAHWLEENAPADTPQSFHGEQIAVTTLIMAKIQTNILHQQTAPQLKRAALPEKNLSAQHVVEINHRLHTDWPTIKQKILEAFIAPEVLEATLKAAGAPTTPQALGWNKTLMNQALTHAPLSRNRLTFLDF